MSLLGEIVILTAVVSCAVYHAFEFIKRYMFDE